jgi:capsular exopolysaccharide synthesis family protein
VGAREDTPDDAVRLYARILRRRKLTIGVVALVVLGLTLLLTALKTPVYTATAQVLVPEQTATSALEPASAQEIPTINVERALSDAQQFAQGDQTQAAVRTLLHAVPKVTVTASTNDDVLTFSTSGTSAAAAARNVNAYTQAYLAANRANQVSQYTSQVSALQASITKLSRRAAALPAKSEQRAAALSSIDSLTQSLQQLQAASQVAAQTGPSIVNAATVPTSPSSPRPVRDAVLAILAGLVLGVGAAVLKDRLDDKVTSKTDVEEASGGLPVVGTIPTVPMWKKAVGAHIALAEDSGSAISEAYRTLRTSIQFLGIEKAPRVVAITSSTPDEGKSTTTANLAVSMARAGQRVAVVSCDFRRPRLHTFFGLDNEIGTTSVLLGQATVSEALRPVPGEPFLRILASGPTPPNPAEILSLGRVGELIEVLAAHADVVLLDCPPVLPVTDTLLIARLCDTMLVLTMFGKTRRVDLNRAFELLEQVQAPVRGTIVNRIPQSGPYASTYGYGYGYASVRSPKPSAPRGGRSDPPPPGSSGEEAEPTLAPTITRLAGIPSPAGDDEERPWHVARNNGRAG